MKTAKIYSLIDPVTGQVRYIGKTSIKLEYRLQKHIKFAEKSKLHVSNWINKLLKDNLKPIIELVDEVNNDEWQYWEQFYINLFKVWGFDLTNLTLGGEGSLGMKKVGKPHTQETKDKISSKNKLIKKTPEWNLKVAKAQYKPIYGVDKLGNMIEFDSLKNAGLFCGRVECRKNICACLKKKRKTAYGYTWFYKNSELEDKEPLR